VSPADYTTPPLGDNVLQNQLCASGVYVGSAVYITSGSAFNGIATSITTSRIVGIVTAKPTSTTCHIATCGFISGVLSGLTENSKYFLSDITPGLVTLTVPSTVNHTVVLIGTPLSSTILTVGVSLIVIRK